ncbi:hypothetical protein BGZ81_003777, partial [Podila clonocystis]
MAAESKALLVEGQKRTAAKTKGHSSKQQRSVKKATYHHKLCEGTQPKLTSPAFQVESEDDKPLFKRARHHRQVTIFNSPTLVGGDVTEDDEPL